jgi:isomerase DpgB
MVSAELSVDGTEPLTTASVRALEAVCDRAESEPGGMVTVRVTGRQDVMTTNGVHVGLVTKWERAVRRLERLPAATVAVATGDCGGLALEVLLATDYRIITPEARLLVASAGGATWPGMGVHRLAQQAGFAKVRRAVLFGEPIGGWEAAEAGLVDEVTEEPEAAVAALKTLAEGLPGKEIAIRRQLLLDAATTSFEDALGAHLAACDRLLRLTAGTAGREAS